MYRYLDRPAASLGHQDQFLIFAMRTWVSAARTGRCDCHRLLTVFQARGIADAMTDFNILMATLNQEGLAALRFGKACASITTHDEARLLALFAAAGEGHLSRLKRIAATLVVDDAAVQLAQATDYVAMALAAIAQ